VGLGELICDWKGKLTSVKVHPFESSGRGVKYELTWLGEDSGRLTGRELGTDYWVVAPDGTGVVDYYGVLTTHEGEVVLVEGHGTTAPTKQGRTRARVAVTFKTTAPKLAWLSNMIAAFESEGDLSDDLSTKVFSGSYVEWK
jgi:hypothetical protein